MSGNKKPELFDIWGDGFVKVFVIFSIVVFSLNKPNSPYVVLSLLY